MAMKMGPEVTDDEKDRTWASDWRWSWTPLQLVKTVQRMKCDTCTRPTGRTRRLYMYDGTIKTCDV